MGKINTVHLQSETQASMFHVVNVIDGHENIKIQPNILNTQTLVFYY